MLQRFLMVLRAFFGRLLRGAEDPEMLLRQYIDDLRSKLPKLRATVAEVLATEIQLEQQADHLRKRIREYDRQIIAALKLGYEEEARMLIAAKAQAEESLQDTLEQLETARRASQQARASLEEYQREMERKIAEARRLIGQAKLTEVQNELAQLMTSLDVGHPKDVLDRMREKVAERVAQARARAEIATTDVDARLKEIRKAAAEIGVDEQLEEYKRRLGLLPSQQERPVLPKAETLPSQDLSRPEPREKKTEGPPGE